MKRGDVAIIDYPYSDGTGRKVRPVLIVQSDVKNAILDDTDDTIVALITSRPHRQLDTHVRVDIASTEGQRSGLRLPSVVQYENLYTIDQKLVLRVIGALDNSLLQKVDQCLRVALSL